MALATAADAIKLHNTTKIHFVVCVFVFPIKLLPFNIMSFTLSESHKLEWHLLRIKYIFHYNSLWLTLNININHYWSWYLYSSCIPHHLTRLMYIPTFLLLHQNETRAPKQHSHIVYKITKTWRKIFIFMGFLWFYTSCDAHLCNEQGPFLH